MALPRYKKHEIDLVARKVAIAWPVEDNKILQSDLSEAVETALAESGGLVKILLPAKSVIARSEAERNDEAILSETGLPRPQGLPAGRQARDDKKSEIGETFILSAKYSCPNDSFSFPEIEPRLFSFNSPYGACEYCHGIGTESIWSETICPKCLGKRLRDEALHVFIGEEKNVELTGMSIGEAGSFFKKVPLTEREQEIASAILKEVQGRLPFMLDVGLDYLTLNRVAGTLSGGEAQRIRLASQIGSRLVGTLYILDE